MKRSNTDDLQIVKTASAEGGYNYYGYVSSGEDSRSMIMREAVDQSEYKYFYGQGSNFDADWTARALKNYIFPNQLGGKN